MRNRIKKASMGSFNERKYINNQKLFKQASTEEDDGIHVKLTLIIPSYLKQRSHAKETNNEYKRRIGFRKVNYISKEAEENL
ncbi:hypothetical protein CWI39_2676p0010 [Hamiltosporidium magnivora]|uniref:Uncharacterized protein n=1 Tax=Hamiltosporidium magnivora TaxID=148818 RepID=A0A4Q9KSY2_9MICR|nr:hypothetical protein CWI39_2676p0010 [Hamiltosporidium magnivora]